MALTMSSRHSLYCGRERLARKDVNTGEHLMESSSERPLTKLVDETESKKPSPNRSSAGSNAPGDAKANRSASWSGETART